MCSTEYAQIYMRDFVVQLDVALGNKTKLCNKSEVSESWTKKTLLSLILIVPLPTCLPYCLKFQSLKVLSTTSSIPWNFNSMLIFSSTRIRTLTVSTRLLTIATVMTICTQMQNSRGSSRLSFQLRSGCSNDRTTRMLLTSGVRTAWDSQPLSICQRLIQRSRVKMWLPTGLPELDNWPRWKNLKAFNLLLLAWLICEHGG